MPKLNLKPNLLVIFFFFLLLTVPFFVGAATLYLMPQSQTIYQEDTFIAEVRLDTEGEEINAVKVDLNFPSNFLEPADFSKGGSILTFWAEEPSVKENMISFVGGIPGGFTGKGLILKISFLGKEIGLHPPTARAEVNFSEDSKVLLNDGKGTPAKLSLLEGNYEVIEKPENLPVISSRSHPDQNKWYKKNTLHLHWDLVEEAQYSYLLSYDPLTEPDDIPDRPEGELLWLGDMEYKGLEDGIYYFALKQKLPGEDWSEKVSFRAMIDVTSPEEFRAEIGQDSSMFEGKYFLSFATTDKTSGIDYYEVKEGRRDFKKAKSPYVLEDQSLRSKILVKAVDKAGNEKISEIAPPKKLFPYWITILILIIVAVIIATVIWWIIKKSKTSRKNYETRPRNINETRPR